MVKKVALGIIFVTVVFSFFSCTSGNIAHTPFPTFETNTSGTTTTQGYSTTTQGYSTTTTTTTNTQYVSLTETQFYDQIFSSSLTQLQKDANWQNLIGKTVTWEGDVDDVLDNNTVMVFCGISGQHRYITKVHFTSADMLSQVIRKQRVFFTARLVDKVSYNDNNWNNNKYGGFYNGVELDQGQFTVSPIPQVIQGFYLESSDTNYLYNVSYTWTGNKYLHDYNAKLDITLTNKTTQKIVGNYFLIVTFTDAAGNELNLFGELVGLTAYRNGTFTSGCSGLNPGQSALFSINISDSFHPFPLNDLDKFVRYEIRIIKM
jgi:hypothetical protein